MDIRVFSGVDLWVIWNSSGKFQTPNLSIKTSNWIMLKKHSGYDKCSIASQPQSDRQPQYFDLESEIFQMSFECPKFKFFDIKNKNLILSNTLTSKGPSIKKRTLILEILESAQIRPSKLASPVHYKAKLQNLISLQPLKIIYQ